MTQIQAFMTSFSQPVEQTIRASKSTSTSETLTQEVSEFSKLLESMSTVEGTKISEGEHSNLSTKLEELKNALQELSEEVMTALQELPSELLSSEEQDMLATVVEMLTVQMMNLMENLQSRPSKQGMVTANGAVAVAPEQQELVQLMQQFFQQLKGEQAVETTNQAVSAGKQTLVPIEQLEQLNQHFSSLIEKLKEDAHPGKQALVRQLEQVKQVLQEVTNSVELLETNLSKPNSQISYTTSINAGYQQQEVSNEVSKGSQGQGQALSQSPTTDNPPPQVAGQIVEHKATQATGKPEAPQSPTVRMSQLIEELSTVMRGSIRLSGSEQGTQLRVNIFPEQFGHLDIRLTAIEGKIQAQIFTSNLMAKELLDQQMNQLRMTLNQQGVTVERIEVTHQNQPQTFNQFANSDQRFAGQQQKQGPAYKQKNNYQPIEEESTIERIRSTYSVGVTKVDYTI